MRPLWKTFRRVGLVVVFIALAGCQSPPITPPDLDIPSSANFEEAVPQATREHEPTALVEVATGTAEATTLPMPSPTSTATHTPLPDHYALVPDLRGLPQSEARSTVAEAGFSFLFQDVLDPDVPNGTVVDQDPPAGMAMPLGEIVFLYRSFQALEMIAGGACQPLLITLPAGKLLYWVELEEGIHYNIRTDFIYGRTQISDYRMYLLDQFDNSLQDSMDIELPAPGRYVISLGPYEVSKSLLESKGRLSAGCLWITPQE